MVSFAYGALISVLSLLVAFWSEPTDHHDRRGHTLLAEMPARDKAILVLYCILENFGFRQLTITWRLKGLVDYLRRKKGWEKFDRIGFAANQPV